MKHKLIIILFILISSVVYSQRIAYAPDFGLVSETNDTTYLYDQLNKGKTVFLVFFGAGCGTCKSDVPALNNIYNDYNQNQSDLFFWAIESNYASYSEINQFESDYNTDYEGWRINAGDSVIQLYNVNYTPYYYVICPDRTYNDFSLDIVPDAIDNCMQTSINFEDFAYPQVKLYKGLITLKDKSNNDYKIEIFSITGKKLLTDVINTHKSISTALVKGIYIYRLSNKKGIIKSGKLFIN